MKLSGTHELRPFYEEAVVNMMSNKSMLDVSFYSFILAKCKVIFDSKLDTCGVNFQGTSYNLYIGNKFKEWTLAERIAVMVHESRHIIGGHMFRKGERDHQMFNIASDMAMNQLIKNLPQGAVYPGDFKGFPKDKTAEQYYELLREEQKKQEKEKEEMRQKNPQTNPPQTPPAPEECPQCNGTGEKPDPERQEGQGQEGQEQEGQEQEGQDGGSRGEECENCGGSGQVPGKQGDPVFDENGEPWKPKNGNPDLTEQPANMIDDHSKWEECDVDNEDLAKSITEKIVKDAVSQSRGNLPGDIENILAIWRRKPVISWKKELKKILSSKKGYRVGTIKRRDRRFPRRNDLRGKRWEKDQHEIVVGIDTSGSMDDSDILGGLVEILEVAKVNKSPLKVIQIDTNIKSIEIFNEKNKHFKRRGYGGTYMGAIVPFIEEQNLKPDVLIMISDMYIEDIDTDENWGRWKPKTLWLNTSGKDNEVTTTRKNHRIINFTDM